MGFQSAKRLGTDAMWQKSWILLVLAVSTLESRLIPPRPTLLETAQLEAGGLESPSFRLDDNSEENYRLPNNTAPEAYRIELWTNVHNGDREFYGTVQIDIEVLEETSEIKLHYRQTEGFAASIVSRDEVNSTEIPLNVTLDPQREFLVLSAAESNKSFAANTKWTLTVNYIGTLRSDMAGFHRTSYMNDNGTER